MQDSSNNSSFPKALVYIQAILFISAILYFGHSLFIPLFFGLMVAIVVYPACKWLEARTSSRALAVTIPLCVVAITFLLLLGLLTWQLLLFRNDIPVLSAKMRPMLADAQQWLWERFSITPVMQAEWLHNAMVNGSTRVTSILLSTFSTTVATLFAMFLAMIFAALFLYHRKIFVKFLYKAGGAKYKQPLDKILRDTVNTYFNYIKSLIFVYIIVGILNSLGLAALGIKHALLFGMLTAIMTIIPYIGIIISAMLPISVAFITKDSIWYPLGVIGVFSFVQYLEANVIFPRVVGAELNVSTWATLIAILAGGVIWGVAGMILFIPFAAILKIATDHIEEWKTLNILLSRNT